MEAPLAGLAGLVLPDRVGAGLLASTDLPPGLSGPLVEGAAEGGRLDLPSDLEARLCCLSCAQAWQSVMQPCFWCMLKCVASSHAVPEAACLGASNEQCTCSLHLVWAAGEVARQEARIFVGVWHRLSHAAR